MRRKRVLVSSSVSRLAAFAPGRGREAVPLRSLPVDWLEGQTQRVLHSVLTNGKEVSLKPRRSDETWSEQIFPQRASMRWHLRGVWFERYDHKRGLGQQPRYKDVRRGRRQKAAFWRVMQEAVRRAIDEYVDCEKALMNHIEVLLGQCE